MTRWTDPGADPLADLRQMAASMPDGGAPPTTLKVNARAATIFAAYSAAHRLIPGKSPWARLKRRVMRWALELYFDHELKPHPYAAAGPVPVPRRGDAEGARLILTALDGGAVLARSELCVAAGLTGTRTNRILADLGRRGLVVSVGRNLVALATKEPSDG